MVNKTGMFQNVKLYYWPAYPIVKGQTSSGRLRLSSSSVCNTIGGRAGRRSRGRSGGRHCRAGQSCYVPLGRHLVKLTDRSLKHNVRFITWQPKNCNISQVLG